MKLRWGKWLYGLGSAVIGGGAGAVVSGFTNIVIAPSTFNFNTAGGAVKVLLAMVISFAVVAGFSLFFYLKQAPLPEADDGDDHSPTGPTITGPYVPPAAPPTYAPPGNEVPPGGRL